MKSKTDGAIVTLGKVTIYSALSLHHEFFQRLNKHGTQIYTASGLNFVNQIIIDILQN